MKLVILAGGLGTRLGQRTVDIPKPMVTVGNMPIIWHIMKTYSSYGISDFIICLGYKGDVIKDYFYNYRSKINDFTVNLSDNSIIYHNNHDEINWKITMVDTGQNTLKGGRLKRIEKYLTDDVNLLTYGDGVADINIEDLISTHKKNNKVVTISGVRPPARFGELLVNNDTVVTFKEKAQTSQGLINGGYMVFNKELLNYLTEDENCDLEYGTFEELSQQEKIGVYMHNGLWACMDHERDVAYLNKLWNSGKAFWKVWK